jgi:hypothetical protein
MASLALRTLATLSGFVFDRKRFRAADHRADPPDRYVFDLAEFPPGGTAK